MCIFCKIVNGEIPSYKIYENDKVYAFLDIAKDADGHTLVIPKKHVVDIMDADSETLKDVMEGIKAVTDYYVSLGYDGVNVMNASGEAAEQSVFHLHFHIIPRKKNDGMHTWPTLPGAKEELSEMHKKLKME
jgi:histidine triad (HIT) family protein